MKRVNWEAGYGLKGDNDSSAPWLREQFERTGPVSRRIASCYHMYIPVKFCITLFNTVEQNNNSCLSTDQVVVFQLWTHCQKLAELLWHLKSSDFLRILLGGHSSKTENKGWCQISGLKSGHGRLVPYKRVTLQKALGGVSSPPPPTLVAWWGYDLLVFLNRSQNNKNNNNNKTTHTHTHCNLKTFVFSFRLLWVAHFIWASVNH